MVFADLNDKNIDIPNSKIKMDINKNKKLTDQSPIKLSWKNEQGITFEKILIALDLKNHFTIKQSD